MFLGIDPANDGGAVLINQKGLVLKCFSWKKVQRQKVKVWKVIYSNDALAHEEIIVKNEVDIAIYIGKYIFDKTAIAIEAPYVDRKFPKSGLDVARVGGIMIGGVIGSMNGYPVSQIWISASNWRYQLLSLRPYTKRAECKRRSLHDMPLLCPSIKDHLKIHGTLDHITDALGVALWYRQKITGWKK
tara:strand:- start:28687 stop:29247 length:561 start_codon:yes stop_codon:yes gene_type:complete